MKKVITKRKVTVCLDPEILKYIEENFENKSKYVEYLIYKDLKANELLEKEIIL